MTFRALRAALFSGVSTFFSREGLSLAAAISFYTILSVSPLLVLLLWLTQAFGIQDEQRVLQEIGYYAGAQARSFAESMLRNLQSQPRLGTIAGILGFGVLIFSAGGVFVQLQSSLNKMWGIRDPETTSIFEWIKRRLISMSVILLLGVLIIVSLLVSSLTSWVTGFLGTAVWIEYAIQLANAAVSLVLFSLFFALIFRYLPDRSLPWKDLLRGGVLTSLLFLVGKSLIGFYLSYSAVASVFGAAGSLAAFLVWVYYSAAIFLLGAELTQQWSLRRTSAA